MSKPKYTQHPDFGRQVSPGRFRVFCEECGLPMLWPERPKRCKYWCDEHEAAKPTPIAPPSGGGHFHVREEAENHNTFDDVVGLHEDGRD